ncbi:MAG: Tetratricopeptide repeat protein [Acidobacteria bacterium OLB17]|nr:MAG: Tetratricopeptide repeat protein [Acidobacteria bacterium OLB17]MCZ2389993.1 tetratricopeptide repeat protein [Acidobacteriota bacterium]
MYRVFFSIVLIAAMAALVGAQDLGSSNKLFGGKDSPKAGTKTSKRPAARKPSARTSRSKRQTPKKAVGSNTSTAKERAAKKLSAEETAKLNREAATAFQKGDLSAAEAKYREVLRSASDDPDAKLGLSRILALPVPVADLGARYEEAMNLARSVTEKEPTNAVAFERLGVAREMLGLVDAETENAYRTAIRLAPERPTGYAYLARVLRRNGNTAAAADMDAAAATRARGAAQVAEVAEILQSEQRYPAAERLLRMAIENEPNNARVLELLGRSQLANGDTAEGIKSLKASLGLDLSNFDVYSALASAYLRTGDPANAENILLRGSRYAREHDKPSLARQFEMLGDAYAKAGKQAESRRAYKMALTYQPERETVLAKLK